MLSRPKKWRLRLAHTLRDPRRARRFELVEGTSSKFWEVSRDGCSVTVRFGRIGTNGQSKTKDFASEELARRHAEGLIEEKRDKGYHECREAGPV